MNFFLALFFYFFGLSLARAHSDEFWLSLKTDFLNIELNYQNDNRVQSRFPKVLRLLLEGPLGWDPGTESTAPMNCDPKDWGASLKLEANVSRKQIVLQKFIESCSVVNSKNSSWGALKTLSQRGSFKNHPFFKYSTLNFPGEIKTRALWGIKSQEKRDLIVVRPGVFASVDELLAERYLLFLLTEINGYHIVVLENSTSGDHIVNNNLGIVAGPKEAFENLYLIDQVRNNPGLAPLVAKIHLLGISLGANGVLLSSIINQERNYRYFDKTLLMCPVVDFHGTFGQQMKNGWSSYLADSWGSQRFKDLLSKNDFKLAPAVSSFFSLTPRWILGAWDWFERKYHFQPEWQSYLSADHYSGDFKKDYSFFESVKPLPDNFYVLATKTDPIVFPSMNFDKLQQRATEKTFFYRLNEGMHCSLAYNYQWKFLDQMFEGILGSKEIESDRASPKKFPIEPEGTLSIVSSQTLNPNISSVEILKLDKTTVELMLYFYSHPQLKNGRVWLPLSLFNLDRDYMNYDSYVVRQYIRRFVQTKSEAVVEEGQYFIKI